MTELGQDPSSGQTLTTPFFRLIFIPTKIETCSYTTHRQFNQLLPPAVNSFYSFYQLSTFVEINIFALLPSRKFAYMPVNKVYPEVIEYSTLLELEVEVEDCKIQKKMCEINYSNVEILML